MALTVEDGTGLENADSYVSVDDADSYLETVGNPHSWDSQSTADKEVALRRATSWLDGAYRKRYPGVRKDADQALEWPRSSAEDFDGYEIDDDSVPVAIERAAAQAAARFLETDLEADRSSGLVSRTRSKVGPIEDETEYVGGFEDGGQEFPQIDAILGRLLIPAGLIERG